ncbi:MAG: DUF5723 family protein [Bacteroidales bacterium]|nr:DUF5723 family protein [Bacteroidales bacterium]MDD6165344.1 DUF5723 family protein [Bacteroidales bacterium]MDD7574232.1 DUF5723 family protein [Bacteroidales bacterium]MDY4583910.1 DUF5723 family protein [Candidatus Onthomorpha sp.]MDY5789690.1 DUF5723 family protein [Candidatus Onthomorpha sp.]
MLSRKHILALLLVVMTLQCGMIKAQRQEISYFFREIPQTSFGNPAMTSTNNFYFSVGAGNFMPGFSTSGLCYHDLIHTHPVYPDSLQIDVAGFSSKLKNNNRIILGCDVDILAFGFRVGKNFFSYDMSFVMDGRLSFSKGIFDLLMYGTDVASGEAALFDGELIDYTAYLSNSFGYAREINDRLTIGVRAKVLNGLVNVNTQRANVRLLFNEQDEINAECDLDIRTSNIAGNVVISSVTQEEATQEFNVEAYQKMLEGAADNIGFAFDLGATYRINDAMEVSLSINDLGFINWKSHCQSVVSVNPGSQVSFEGVSASIDELGNSFEQYFSDIVDSLKTAFDIHTVESSSYRTSTPMKIRAGYSWRFANNNFLHALASCKLSDGGHFEPAASLFYGFHSKYFTFSAGNTFNSASAFNPSFLMNCHSGVFDFHFGTTLDIARGVSFNVADLSGVSFIVGANIAIGSRPYWKKID